MRGGKRLRWVMIFIGILGVALAAFFLFSQWIVLRAGEGRLYTDVAAIPPRQAGLLLGTSEWLANGRRNLFFTYRIEAAAELYKHGKVQHLLVSGDNATERYNEPTAMKNALVKAGVPESAITLDYAGFRTLDSVVRAEKVFGLSEYTIISQRFHDQRALFIARYYGADAIGFCARDVSRRAALKTRVREMAARVKVLLDLYILGTAPKFSGPPEPIEWSK